MIDSMWSVKIEVGSSHDSLDSGWRGNARGGSYHSFLIMIFVRCDRYHMGSMELVLCIMMILLACWYG